MNIITDKEKNGKKKKYNGSEAVMIERVHWMSVREARHANWTALTRLGIG